VSFGTNSHYFFILIRASKLRQNGETPRSLLWPVSVVRPLKGE